MAAVPIAINGVFYPSNKKDPPIKGVMFGNAFIPGLGVGGGPIQPPPDIKPQPPLVIWGGPFDPPHPAHPIVLPPEPPPTTEPPSVTPPHEGWNWSAAKSGWYYLGIPGKDEASPKR